MSEVWVAAAVGVAGSVASGMAAEKKDKSDKAHDAAMTKDESRYAAQRTSHEMALEDFYTQKERAKKQRGLDQYRQFSTMQESNPNYNPATEPRIEDPTMPKYADFDETPKDIPNKQTKKRSKSFLDPLGLF